jgi:hypothetical protein
VTDGTYFARTIEEPCDSSRRPGAEEMGAATITGAAADPGGQMRHGDRLPLRRSVTVPVFVDPSGRRRRLAVAVGAAIAVALLGGLSLLVAVFSNGVPVSVPQWPASGPRHGGAQVVAPPGSPRVVTSGRTEPAGTTPATPPAPAARTPAPAATIGPTVTAPAAPGHGNGRGRPTDKPTKSPGKPA